MRSVCQFHGGKKSFSFQMINHIGGRGRILPPHAKNAAQQLLGGQNPASFAALWNL